MFKPLSCALALALAPFATPALADTKASLDIPYQEFTLSNGLRVVVHEDRKAPIVAVNVWYHVGSKNELPGRTGFAHLFEHLMFQGSENYRDEFFKPFEKVGATEQNGTTNFDRTNYFQNVPTTAIDTALWMESDRMGHFLGAIDQKTLDEQRGVVQNEKRQGENSPYGKEFERMLLGIFPEGHPYRWEVIGSMDDLNAATVEDVKAWFKTWYGPSNTVIVLAGDIDLATAKAKMQQYFGAIPPGGPLAKKSLHTVQLDAPKRDVAYDRVAQTRVSRVWGSAAATQDDADDLNLLARALGGGKTSRLYKRLVQDEQLVSDVSVFNYGLEIAGLFLVSADLNPGTDAARVEAIFDEELNKLLADKTGITDDELQRAATVLEAGFLRGAERIGGFGGKSDILAECTVYTGSPDCYKKSLALMSSATPARVKAAGKKWLTPNHFTLITKPFADFKAETETVDRSKGVPEPTQFPDLKFPNIQRAKLNNGIEVVLAERNETPVVQMRMLFDAGFAADQGRKLGTSSFTLNMLDEGTTTLNTTQIAERAEALGMQLSTSNSLDSSSASMSALSRNLEASLKLYADVVRNPSFAADAMARIKKQTLAQIAQEKTEPNSIAIRTIAPLLYGNEHPYGIPLTGSGTEQSVESITETDLKAFYQAAIRPDNARIVVSGAITLEQAVAALNKAFGDWKAPSVAKVSKTLAEVPSLSKPRLYLLDKPNAEQSMIIAGNLVPGTGSPQRQQLQTANGVFGGEFTARINMNLREDKHWAYGAYSFAIDTFGQSPLIAQASVQTDKTAESMQELLREFKEFSSTRGPSEEEIAKIKGNDVRSLPGRYETSNSVLSALSDIVVNKRADNYVQTLKASIEAQSNADITAAAARHYRPEQLTWVVVGDLAKIEAGIRKLGFEQIQVLDANGKVVR
jgi:zinc protease